MISGVLDEPIAAKSIVIHVSFLPMDLDMEMSMEHLQALEFSFASDLPQDT